MQLTAITDLPLGKAAPGAVDLVRGRGRTDLADARSAVLRTEREAIAPWVAVLRTGIR